jgi:ubiquitin C-terminal hydrolase
MHVDYLEIFNLYGFIIHEGEQSRKGHYKCVVKGIDDEWYYCNDSKIKKVGRPISKEDTENAYMLFYQKQT